MLNRLSFLVFVIIFISASYVLSQEEAEVGEEVGQSIIDVLNQVLPPNADRVIQLDEKTGRLFVQDTPSNHKIIQQIVRALDQEPAQVSIETRFVELKLTDTDELTMNWGSTFLWYGWGPSPDVSPAPPESVPGSKVPKWRARGINPTTRAVDDIISFAASTTAGLDLSIAKLNTNKLDAFLHALEKNDKANLLSSPKITTISGQLANIQITQTAPYIENDDITIEEYTSGGITYWLTRHSVTMNEVPIGIKLEVKPTVGEAGIITLELHPEVEVLANRLTIFSGVSDSDLGWPVVDTRSCQTTVQVKSGETVVMGGLIDDDDKVYDKKVPVLGDIPLLGNLFRSKYVRRVKKNLLIFVTATLINPSGEVARANY